MTITRPRASTELVNRLITIGIEVAFATERRNFGPKSAAARARLDGACEVLSVLGYAMTPFSAEMAVLDALRSVGEPPAPNTPARKAWHTQARTAVANALREAI